MRFKAPLFAVAFVASPALADHSGPSGVAGGSLNIMSPHTLEEGEAAIGFRLAYTRPDQRSDAELADLAGHHIHAHNSDYNLNASAGIAYGAARNFTLSFELPFVRRDGLREGTHGHSGGQAINDVKELGTVQGLGDASLLARYQLVDGPGALVTLIGGLKLPTGSTHKRSNDGERLETEHQPGTGSWDPLFGAAFGSPLGPMHLTASALYQFSGRGDQSTRLGDRAQGGIALSHRFGPPEDHHEEAHDHEDGGHSNEQVKPHGHQSWDAFLEISGEWEGQQKVDGEIEQDSGGKAIWLGPGARFNSAGGLSVGAAIGVPVWQNIRASHPDNKIRFTVAVGRRF